MKFYELTYRSDGSPDGFAHEFFTSKAEAARALGILAARCSSQPHGVL